MFEKIKKHFKKIVIALLGIFTLTAAAATNLPVPQGGTGASTLTGVVVGNGQSSFTTNTTGDLASDLNIDSDTFVISYDDNKVGIGTDSPTEALDVNGNIEIGNNHFQMNDMDMYRSSGGLGWVSMTLQPNTGDKAAVLRFVPSGTVTNSAMEFYDSSSQGGGDRAVFKINTGTLSIGGDVANKIIQFVQSNHPVVTITTAGNVGIGTITPTAYLHLKAGTVAASTAPLKLTSGTLNTVAEAGALEYDGTNFYFSPANNNRKEVAFSDSNFAEMYLYANTTVTVIDTADAWHSLSLSEITVGVEDGWIYADGTTGSDITTYATYDGGASTLVTTTAAHNLSADDYITITGTTNYNDIYEVLSAPSATTFEIDKSWDTNNDATGTYNRGGSLTAGANSAGIYRIEWNITITPQTNNHIFTASGLIEKNACEKCRARLRMGTAGDYSNMGTSSFVEVVAGDKISFLVKNVGATGNLIVRHGNLNLNRL